MSFFLRTFLLLAFPSTVYGSEAVFNITRTTASNQEDQFIIPSSVCESMPRQSECRRFHMRSFIHGRKCECSCPYEASTFGFDSGSWSCLKNTNFRKKAGCTYKFEYKYDSFPVEVLETRQPQRPTIRLSTDTCKTDIPSSRYLECDGSWSGLDLSKYSDIFKLRTHSTDDGGSSWDYEFEITEKASLAGRVIKLQLNCDSAAKSSCVLFKIAGKIACPVDPTKKSSVASDGQKGGSSGTVAAIVIVIIIIIIVAAIMGFIIWKRRRGENVWLADRVASIVTILRNRSSAPKAAQEDQQEQVYAEIPDQPVQPRYGQNTPALAASSQTGTRTAMLLSGGIVASEPTDDDDGYAVPPDSPEYKELEDPKEQNTGVDDGNALPPDSPEYKELEDPNEQNTGENGEAMKTENNSEQEVSREATNNLASGPGFSAAADNRYVTKQRRKPPSPPQKGNGTQERRSDTNDDTSVKECGEGRLEEIHDYERLRDENRDVYQPLDRDTMINR